MPDDTTSSHLLCAQTHPAGGGEVCQITVFIFVMVSVARTSPRSGESEGKSNHPDDVSPAMPPQGGLPELKLRIKKALARRQRPFVRLIADG